MSNVVGIKGQIVIEKSIREKLGVKPGWKAIQTLADDHIEIYLVPPEHDRSLAGCLANEIGASAPTTEDLNKAREAAWISQVQSEYSEYESTSVASRQKANKRRAK